MNRAGVGPARRSRGSRVALLAAGLLAWGGAAEGQQPVRRAITLEEALRVAEDQSEQIAMSRAGVLRSEGQHMQSRSELFPQLSASLAYTRALASEFEGAFGGGGQDTTTAPPLPVCPAYDPDPSLPIEQRVSQIEAQFNCTESAGGGIDFANLPFGRENTYRFGLSFSQNLFSGGRITAQTRASRSGLETARIGLRQSQAQLALDVTQAYYDAVLSDRLLAIAQATLEQSEATLRQATVARQVGTQPEFELLRAQVTRDNQRPVVIQRRADRDLAYLRLKQLLNVPAAEQIVLTSDLREEELVAAGEVAAAAAPDSALVVPTPVETPERAVVRQAEEAVVVQESMLDVARSQRLPSLVLTSQYGRVAYPTGLPEWSESRANWNVGLSLSLPLFTGGRLRGGERVARANLLESRARLQQVRELAELDSRSAIEQMAAAEASWRASSGTVEQAQRAYQIAEVRYREGISTQIELSDSRILLQQAQANRAMAARNLQIARARVQLLPYLPLGAGGAAGAGQQGQGAEPPAQQQQPQQAPPQQAADASLTGISGMGGI